jgi:hypothetical protein
MMLTLLLLILAQGPAQYGSIQLGPPDPPTMHVNGKDVPLTSVPMKMFASHPGITQCTGWCSSSGASFLWCRNARSDWHWIPAETAPHVPNPWPEELRRYAVIHKPKDRDCPAGYSETDKIFAKNGKPVAACVSNNPNFSGSDYLGAGESQRF